MTRAVRMKLWSGLVVVLLMGVTACDQSREADERQPNIILIVADDLGYGDLGSYGQDIVRTPNLDRMAEEGLRFTDFYSGSTVCAPARSVLMDGRHTGHTYIRGNRAVWPYGQEPIPDSVVTMAEVLRDAGYRTGLIGKWGLGGPDSPGHPNQQGFDHFFGYLGQRHAHNYYPEFLFFNQERVDVPGNRLPEPKREDGAGEAVEKVTYSHNLFADSALAFIERNEDRPFFLFLALTIPHANNEAGVRGMEVPDYGAYADESWPEPQKGLAAMITRMDRDVGSIMARLRESRLSEHTLVLFTSDNGPHAEGGNDPDFFNSNGPLRGIKRDLYEGGIRVPAIAWWPGRVPAGAETDHVGYFPDLMPTFARLAGAPHPQDVDGIDLTPTLLGRPDEQQDHPFLYWEFYEGGGRSQAVRTETWKGVRPHGSDIELYDLASDVAEANDLAAAHPAVAARVDSLMRAAHKPSPIDWTKASR